MGVWGSELGLKMRSSGVLGCWAQVLAVAWDFL